MAIMNEVKAAIAGDVYKDLFEKLYGRKHGTYIKQQERYLEALSEFSRLYGDSAAVSLFSTPGRTEVGGNHTDHNGGRVLSAAVNLDAIAVAAPTGADRICLKSQGYAPVELDIGDLGMKGSERGTTVALIRGVCARLKALGYRVGGFNAFVTSNVLEGSGLSSSASFEVLVVTILNYLYNEGRIDDVSNAIIAQYAENEYFGKPCGLMDQTTCAVGGMVTIDFRDFDHPEIEKVAYDFADSGYSMVITDTGGSHADLTGDYTDLEHEMKEVARALGGKVLRDFSIKALMENVASLRGKVNDRAILRAFHFYYDDARVVEQVKALRRNDFNAFLKMIIASGENSWMLCQNCYAPQNVKEQGVSIALAVSERILEGKGAWRVHGGGFAGTIQAFVPKDSVNEYLTAMGAIFGEKACHELIIRPYGTIRL